jgi:hypothetical protein
MKEDEIGGTCNTHRRDKLRTKFGWRMYKEISLDRRRRRKEDVKMALKEI